MKNPLPIATDILPVATMARKPFPIKGTLKKTTGEQSLYLGLDALAVPVKHRLQGSGRDLLNPVSAQGRYGAITGCPIGLVNLKELNPGADTPLLRANPAY